MVTGKPYTMFHQDNRHSSMRSKPGPLTLTARYVTCGIWGRVVGCPGDCAYLRSCSDLWRVMLVQVCGSCHCVYGDRATYLVLRSTIVVMPYSSMSRWRSRDDALSER